MADARSLSPHGWVGEIQRFRERCECGGWSRPAQLVNVIEDVDVGPQRREIAKEQRPIPLLFERRRQRAGPRGIHTPRRGIGRNQFEVADFARTAAVDFAPHPGRPG